MSRRTLIAALLAAGALVPVHRRRPRRSRQARRPAGRSSSSSTRPTSSAQYYAEILRAEGLNEFAVADVGSLSAQTLSALSGRRAGGDRRSAAPRPASSTPGSRRRQPRRDAARRRPGRPARARLGHRRPRQRLSAGRAGPRHHRRDDAVPRQGRPLDDSREPTAVATLHSERRPPATANPAVTLRTVGAGQAAAFTYDLARSVVYTRQGNPAWAGDERDGELDALIRSDDLFFGASPGPQPDWVDLDKVAIPQADEQQRLLANLDHRDERGPHAAAALLVPPARREGGRGHDRRRPRQRRHRGAVQRLQGGEPGGLLRRELGVHPVDVLRLPNTPIPNAEAFEQDGFEIALHLSHGLRQLHPGVAARQLGRAAAEFRARVPHPRTRR